MALALLAAQFLYNRPTWLPWILSCSSTHTQTRIIQLICTTSTTIQSIIQDTFQCVTMSAHTPPPKRNHHIRRRPKLNFQPNRPKDNFFFPHQAAGWLLLTRHTVVRGRWFHIRSNGMSLTTDKRTHNLTYSLSSRCLIF